MISNTTAWLPLAAAPTFAAMALLTGIGGGGNMLCSAQDASLLTGMVQMYLLMSAFHSAPWLKLISSRRRAGLSTPLEKN
jgi:tetrahydromethanopterin S-methyltransferase subunit D